MDLDRLDTQAEGLLLDRVNPGWRRQYSGARFTLDGLLGGA
jgi:hypothetical protein